MAVTGEVARSRKSANVTTQSRKNGNNGTTLESTR